MKIRSKVWLESEDGQYLLGEGRSEIFRAVDRLGSLSAAAKELQMSYRALWGKVRSCEERLGLSLIDGSGGGSRRGGARLTEAGREFVRVFDEFHARVEHALEDEARRLMQQLQESGFDADA